MKNKSFLAFIFISIILFMGLIFSIYKLITKKTESFYADGYVSISDVESSKKIYFSEGTSYKRDYTKDIVFKDIDDVKQEASKYSFVFFNDKSINYLTDGVLMDLGSLSSTFIPYYNIKSNYLIAYKDGKYIIDSKDKDIILDNFIGKINDNKYLVAGNNLKLKISSSDELIANYYFELNFGEGNLVKIDNDKMSLETISDECYIMVGEHIKIDLSKGIILYDDEIKANLSEIIINHDENINIAYDNNTTVKDNTENNNEENANTGTNVGNIIVPTIEKEYDYKTETVIDYKNIPYVELVNSNVNSHKISLDFKVNDVNKLITGGVNVKYVDLSTGETTEKAYANYSGTIEFIADDLKSNNDYLVTISSSYIKNGNIYRDYNMFQRVFSTRDMGVSLERDYVTSSEIGYNIDFSNDATFTNASLNLYDQKGNLVDKFDFTNNHQPLSIVFDNLDSNKKYTAKIENISFGNVIYTGGAAAETLSMTLKHNPFKDSGIIASPTAVVNKKDYTVKFDLGLIPDEDNIIKTITYNIYDKATNDIIDTIHKDNLDAFDIKVEGKIKAYYTYYYKAVVTMQDNEKTIEYESLASNDFKMDAKVSPTMRFITNSLTANTAKGYFVITDSDNTIDKTQSVYAEYVSSLGEKLTQSLAYTECPESAATTSKCVSLELENLNSDDIYTVSLMAYIDLKDTENAAGFDQVGAIKINTQKADVIITNMTASDLDEAEAIAKIFEVNINFSLEDGASEIIKENMNSFDIRLYEGADATGSFLSSIHVDNSVNIASTYFDNTKTLTLKDFGLTLEDLQRLHITEGGQIAKRYTIRLSNGISGSDYVEFKPYSITFDINDILIGLSNNDATIEVTPILNSESAEYYNNALNENTIVGLKAIPNFGNKKFVTGINFTIIDITLNKLSSIEIKKEIELEEGSIIPTYDFMFNDYSDFLKRGRVYKISYTLDLDLNGDGETDLVYPFLSGDINTPNPVASSAIEAPKQVPSMILFPWTSDDASVTYKYSITDVDNALPNNFRVNYTLNETDYEAEDAICNNPNGVRNYTSNYNCMKIHSLASGDNYGIFLSPILIDNQAASRVNINNYVFEGSKNINSVSYALELNEEDMPKYNNIFSVKLADEDESNAYLNRIAYYTLEFGIDDGNKKFKIDNINGSTLTSPLSSNLITYYENGREVASWTSANRTDNLSKVAYISTCEDEMNLCLYVDYSKLYTSNTFKTYFKAFKNKNISVSLSAAYDSGKIAYDAAIKNQKYAFQIISSDNIIKNDELLNNRYLILYGSISDRINYSLSALSAAYAYANSQGGFVDDAEPDRNVGSGNMYLINTIYSNLTTNQNSNFIRLNYLVSRNGIEVNLGTGANQIKVPIVAKALSTEILSGTANFSYEKVVPALNVMGKTSTVNGIKLDLQLLGLTDADITEENGNRYLYLEVYNNNEELVRTIKINKEHLQSQEGNINDNFYHINTDDDYKVDLTSINSNSDLPEYAYYYKTGNIVFKEDVADGTIIKTNYRIVLDNLKHNETYHLKAYVKMENGSKTYLAGNNATYQNFNYEFTTKDTNDVVINNAAFDVSSSANYQNRYLETDYIIDDIVGIDSLDYEICNEDKSICVDVSKFASCDSPYVNYAGTCFTKTGSSYNAHISHDISLTDNLDFAFGSNYSLIIKAKVTEKDKANEYEIYNSSLPLRALNMPTVSVTKRSGFKDNKKPYLSFDIKFTDNDRVISKPETTYENGKYIVYLANGPEKVKVVGSEKVLNVTNNVNDITSMVTYENLTPSSEYYLIVEYKTYANNLGQNANSAYSIPYLIFTLDDNGISIGKMEYQALPNTTILKFGYASNITRDYILENDELVPNPNQEAYVAGITYTITRNSGDNLFRIHDTVIFDETNPIEHKNDTSSKETVGDDYYQITLNNTIYPVVAGYNILFRFYLGGQEASQYTTEEACKNANISNYWNSISNECYILDDANYSGYTLYEGGSAA